MPDERMTDAELDEVVSNLKAVPVFGPLDTEDRDAAINLINQLRTQLTLAEQQRDAAIGALELCEKYDTSPTPDYGQHDRRGVKPPAGQRWKTPREHARDTLTRIRELGKMEGK